MIPSHRGGQGWVISHDQEVRRTSIIVTSGCKPEERVTPQENKKPAGL